MHKSLQLVDGGYRHGESGIETTISSLGIFYGLYQECAHVVSLMTQKTPGWRAFQFFALLIASIIRNWYARPSYMGGSHKSRTFCSAASYKTDWPKKSSMLRLFDEE